MYVTRRLSHLQQSPELVAAPPDGPNSGYLVIEDDDSVTYTTCCFGTRRFRNLDHQLPFPQDKEITVYYNDEHNDSVFFIPVLNRPLSSNRYHAIVPHGKRIGEAWSCSKGENQNTASRRSVKDVKPRPLDPANIYQQFEIVPARSNGYSFYAKSIASDGFPPSFLRDKGWYIHSHTPDTFQLRVARGLNPDLRACLPELDSPASRMVGKWYTPFIFVKEGSLRDQVKNSMYYEITLEQGWELIFKTDRQHNKGNSSSVVIDVTIEKEQVFVCGSKAAWDEGSRTDGVIWFRPIRMGVGVGLRAALVERMKWEQERGGWMGRENQERQVKINKVVEIEDGSWNEFRCYVLVERFNLKRMDGSLAMTYDFNHFHHLKTKWE